tara:strand:- start:4567 stop:5109 length:543 start_codon:yes stop_codon:yes gene_type:complete
MTKITVTGIAQWAKVFSENRDLDGYQGQWKDTDGRCTIEMILDQDNSERVKDSGCMSSGKDDPEGRGRAFKFSRKFETPNDWDGGAPAVYKPDGSKWDFESDGPIGNGSEVLVELDIYKNKQYSTVTTRLERVKVMKHVSFNGSGTSSGPDPFTKDVTSSDIVAASQVNDVELASDEIPF